METVFVQGWTSDGLRFVEPYSTMCNLEQAVRQRPDRISDGERAFDENAVTSGTV